MVSIPYTMVDNQGQQMRPPTPYAQEQEEQTRYRLVVRFGKDLLQDGFTAVPNLLLDVYAELGITHCELVFILHLLQYKWSNHDPYPSLGTIATKMGLSLRAVQNHVQSLRHKAFRCPHQHEGVETQTCSCPKYLVVSHRYRAGIGQTSSSYNLSGLFAAIITLAHEKGLLPQEDRAKNCTPPHEERCTGGVKKPADESDESSKNTQLESNESFSNHFKDESVVQACSQGEQSAIRNTQGRTTPQVDRSTTVPPSSHDRNTATPLFHHTPLPPRVREPSNLESSPSREMGGQRKSFSRNDEVKRVQERPVMSGPPLTQQDMDKRIRERLARERARTQMQNPLPDIIRDEDWNKLEQDHSSTSKAEGLRCKPMPVYQELQRAVERISQELGDFHHAKSNITRTDNIRREADVSLEQLLSALSEAHHITRVALQKGSITKRDKEGRLIKMSYFFAVLRQKLGLPPKGGQAL